MAFMRSRIQQHLRHGPERERRAYHWARTQLHRRVERERLALAAAARVDPRVGIDPALGYRQVRLGPIPPAAEVATAARTLVRSECETGEPTSSSRWERDLRDLDLDSPYLRMATDPTLVAAISSYLGIVPVLASIHVSRSGHAAGQLAAVEHYHCDWEDLTQVKVLVFATDVDESSGPLTVLSASDSDRVRLQLGRSFRRREPAGHADDDQALLDAMEDAVAEPLLGRPGDVVLLDTSRCLHRDKETTAPGNDRIVAVFDYLRPSAAGLPWDFRAGAPFAALAERASTRPVQLLLGGG